MVLTPWLHLLLVLVDACEVLSGSYVYVRLGLVGCALRGTESKEGKKWMPMCALFIYPFLTPWRAEERKKEAINFDCSPFFFVSSP